MRTAAGLGVDHFTAIEVASSVLPLHWTIEESITVEGDDWNMVKFPHKRKVSYTSVVWQLKKFPENGNKRTRIPHPSGGGVFPADMVIITRDRAMVTVFEAVSIGDAKRPARIFCVSRNEGINKCYSISSKPFFTLLLRTETNWLLPDSWQMGSIWVVDGSGNATLYSAAQTDGSATPRERSHARRGKYTLQRAMGSRRWWRLW